MVPRIYAPYIIKGCFFMNLRDLKLDISYVISMDMFLKQFVGIDNRDLAKAKHKELKFFNLATTVPLDIITKESVLNGDILLVRDSSNNIAPYKNPNRVKKEGKVR